MTRLLIALPLAAVLCLGTASAVAQEVPPPPAPAPAPPAPAPAPADPCADPVLRCPDLVTGSPGQMQVIHTRGGRTLLGSRNRLVNRGAGPLSLDGRRATARTMTVTQRVYRRGRGFRAFPVPAARFDFWLIPGQGRYWKLRDGLRFELWTAGRATNRKVTGGRKTRFCMRDLLKAPGRPGPRRRVFPGCNQDPKAKSVRMGISRGWVESYPPGYFEQYVDVTGLRGCFSLRHIADPEGNVLEADETNNTSSTVLRLPFRRGSAGRC